MATKSIDIGCHVTLAFTCFHSLNATEDKQLFFTVAHCHNLTSVEEEDVSKYAALHSDTVRHDGEERRDDDAADAERALPETDPHQVDVECGRQQEEVTYVHIGADS